MTLSNQALNILITREIARTWGDAALLILDPLGNPISQPHGVQTCDTDCSGSDDMTLQVRDDETKTQ